jgi:hypothetical protein
MAKNEHYIDNKRFLKEIVDHRKAARKAERENLPRPGVNDYIGQCFMDIALNLAKKPNFANYPFKEEMIGDAIENCIMYSTNFDPNKSKNPFAFFTQIIFYAFLRRIQKEKKQLYIKMKQFEQVDPTGKFRNWLKDKFEPENNPFADVLQMNEEEMLEFEKKIKPKKKKAVKKTKVNKGKNHLDNFLA